MQFVLVIIVITQKLDYSRGLVTKPLLFGNQTSTIF
jgi:hypothetical protein